MSFGRPTTTARRQTVLVVDDDTTVAGTMLRYLQHAGFAGVSAASGTEALALARTVQPDLIVLDRMLPGVDGLSVCRILREESRVPIILLTALTTEEHRLEGLDAGADDYVVKPFSPRELVARVRAVLRRSDAPAFPIRVGELELDLALHEARVRGELVQLTVTEFNLLATLARSPGRVFSRAELTTELFGWDYDGSERVIDAHVKNVRQKVERHRDHPTLVETVFGVGYRITRSGGRSG